MPQITPPPTAEIEQMLAGALPAWKQVTGLVDSLYEMDTLWSTGGKAAKYEFKYRRGGKTLCALYPREGSFGFMVVLGRAEQEKFEQQRGYFDPKTVTVYDGTHVYHDGRWMMLDIAGNPPLEDIELLLRIKRRPNRKA